MRTLGDTAKNIEYWQLKQRQSLPLEAKVVMTNKRVREWYDSNDGNVYVSFSGGKDSTVLLHLVRRLYPEVVAVFIDTGLEYPEIVSFVNKCSNVTKIKPKLSFKQIIDKYGFPVVSKEVADKIYEIRTTKSDKLKSKRLFGDSKGNGKLPEKWKYLIDCDIKISDKCCDVMKKTPAKRYEKSTGFRPFIGSMAADSRGRVTSYVRRGCNSFGVARPISNPLGFWLEQDIWDYIKINNIEYSKIYDMGYKRTGCMFCMFGAHLEKAPNKFQLMKQTHPKLYEYCINTLCLKKPLELVGVNYT